MNRRHLISAGKWIAGVAAYLAVSVVVSHFFVSGMRAWAVEHGNSRFFVFEVALWGRPVFMVCLICGALYAAPFAKPACFGNAARIWKYLASTYFLTLLGCILLVRSQFLPLPDFRSDLALQVYLFFLIGLPFVCFVLALLAWIRLAFGRADTEEIKAAKNTN